MGRRKANVELNGLVWCAMIVFVVTLPALIVGCVYMYKVNYPMSVGYAEATCSAFPDTQVAGLINTYTYTTKSGKNTVKKSATCCDYRVQVTPTSNATTFQYILRSRLCQYGYQACTEFAKSVSTPTSFPCKFNAYKMGLQLTDPGNTNCLGSIPNNDGFACEVVTTQEFTQLEQADQSNLNLTPLWIFLIVLGAVGASAACILTIIGCMCGDDKPPAPTPQAPYQQPAHWEPGMPGPPPGHWQPGMPGQAPGNYGPGMGPPQGNWEPGMPGPAPGNFGPGPAPGNYGPGMGPPHGYWEPGAPGQAPPNYGPGMPGPPQGNWEPGMARQAPPPNYEPGPPAAPAMNPGASPDGQWQPGPPAGEPYAAKGGYEMTSPAAAPAPAAPAQTV